MKRAPLRSPRRRLAAGAAMLGLAAATSALADTRPTGVVEGTVALTGLSADSFRVTVLDPDDDAAEATITVAGGDRFSLPIQGDQTYDTIGVTLRYPNGQVHVSVFVPFTVTSGATTTLDSGLLVAPAGAVHVTSPVSGGTLLSAEYRAQAVLTGDIQRDYDARSRSATFPMAAVGDASIEVQAVVTVNGPDGAALCTAPVTASTQIAIAPGATTDVVVPLAVDPTFCSTGFRGHLLLAGLDDEDVPSWDVDAFLHGDRDTPQGTGGNGNDVDYDLANLDPDAYEVSALVVLAAGVYQFHPRGPIVLQDGQRTTIDFFDDVGFGTGGLTVRGVVPDKTLAFFERDDGDTADIVQPQNGTSFRVPLGQGQPATPWRHTRDTVSFQAGVPSVEGCNARTFPRSVSFLRSAPEPKDVVAGADTDFGSRAVAVATGSMSVSRAAAPDADVFFIDASRVDEATGDTIQISTLRFAQIPDHATFVLTAPPGRYAGTVTGLDGDGDPVPIDSGVLELGAPIATLTGDRVAVDLLDGAGRPLGVKVTFEHVTQAGDTTATASSMGVDVPEPLHAATNAFAGLEYLDLSTTAKFTGKVEVCVDENLDALDGLDAGDMAALRSGRNALHVETYTCKGCGFSCAFANTDEVFGDPTSPLSFPHGPAAPRHAVQRRDQIAAHRPRPRRERSAHLSRRIARSSRPPREARVIPVTRAFRAGRSGARGAAGSTTVTLHVPCVWRPRGVRRWHHGTTRSRS